MAAQSVTSLKELVARVTGRSVQSETVYGFCLQNGAGERRVYFGLECRDGRASDYIGALRPGGEGGGQGHRAWGRVPGRARLFWQLGFHYRAEEARGVYLLRDAPVSLENAAACEAVACGLGKDAVAGGLLALSQREPHVQDACDMMLWHNSGRCVCCGGQHMAATCPGGIKAPPQMRGLKRRVEELEAGTVASAGVVSLGTAAERMAMSLEALAGAAVQQVADRRTEQSAAREASAQAWEEERAERVANAQARQEERALRAAEQRGREAREARDLALQPLAPRCQWETRQGPRLTEQALRPRALPHVPHPDFRALPAFQQAFGDADTVIVHAFALHEVYGEYDRARTARLEAAEVGSSRRLRVKMASNFVLNWYPKHVQRAVAAGVLPGPQELYMKKVKVRQGNSSESVVVKVDDFVKVYRTP